MQVSAMQNSSARMLFYTDSQRSLAKDLPKVRPPSLNNPRLSKTSCLNDQGHRPFMASKKRIRSITLQVAPSKIASAGQPTVFVAVNARWSKMICDVAKITRVPGPTFRASHRTSCGQDAYLPKTATSLALCRWDLQLVSTYRIQIFLSTSFCISDWNQIKTNIQSRVLCDSCLEDPRRVDSMSHHSLRIQVQAANIFMALIKLSITIKQTKNTWKPLGPSELHLWNQKP